MRKATVEYPPGSGSQRDATVMDVKVASEPWAEYELEDGSTVRSRTTLIEIVRIENEYDLDGNPIYQVKASAAMSVIAPEKLKKAPK